MFLYCLARLAIHYRRLDAAHERLSHHVYAVGAAAGAIGAAGGCCLLSIGGMLGRMGVTALGAFTRDTLPGTGGVAAFCTDAPQ